MPPRVSLYPINGLAGSWDDEQFDYSVLPATIVPGVTIEDVSSMFTSDAWSLFEDEMGKRDVEALKAVRFAIVHRYQPTYLQPDADEESSTLVHNIAACLRLIRPMRQFALLIAGDLQANGAIQIRRFNHPVHLQEIPSIQKGFFLRNRDIDVLKSVAPAFLMAMAGEYWKFRMPVSLYEAGHFQDDLWKSRFILWCSAIEAIYTSQTRDREHSGSRVAKARIKWFLGANTKIYAPGDVPSFAPQSEPTIADIVDDLYEVRNCIAHGDKVPDSFFQPIPTGLYGPMNRLSVLEEGASFIVRASLLRMLKDNLLNHFRGGAEAQTYFMANGMVRSLLP